jgi:hypothetical protein
MPRFSNENIAVLKETMIKRMPECIFTQVDYEHITRDTGLESAQIEFWEENIRRRNSSVEEMADFLNNNQTKKVRQGRVSYCISYPVITGI